MITVKVILFFIALVFCSISSDFQDLLILDCTGKLTAAPWLPIQSILDVDFKDYYEAAQNLLYDRYKTCWCPSVTKNQFLSKIDYLAPDFWINFINGGTVFDICDPVAPLFNLSSVVFEPLVSAGCTLENYQNGEQCAIQATLLTGVSIQFAFQKCTNQVFPFVSITCGGSGCQSLGKFCNSDAECTDSLSCTNLNVTGGTGAPLADSDFLNALRSMLLYSSNQSPPDPSKFFADIITFVRSQFWETTIPYQWGTPPLLRICLPSNLAQLTQSIPFGCSASGGSVTTISCSGITSWNGQLNDGSMVDSADRLAGNLNPDFTLSTTDPVLPPDASNKPSITLAYLTCQSQIGLGRNLNGLIAGAILAKIPEINNAVSFFYSEIYSMEVLRAQTYYSYTLGIPEFDARFGWIPDWLMYNFFQVSNTYSTAFSDWTIPQTQRFVPPSTCSYSNWLNTQSCSFQFTGLQSILNLDITIRVLLTSCGGFHPPEITIDCYGNDCPVLLGDFTPCSTSASCPSGTACINPLDILQSYVNLTVIDNFFSWGNSIESCSTDTYLTDIISFLNAKAKYPTSGGICYFDFTKLFSGSFNFTAWLSDIAIVKGNTITSGFLSAWTPNYPPATPLTISFTIAVSPSTTYNEIVSLLNSIFTSNNFNLNQITITITLTLKRSSSAQVTITTTNPNVANTLTQQLQDTTSPLNQQLNSTVGPVSGVVAAPSGSGGVRDYQSVSWLFVVFGQLLLLWWYL